MKILGNFLDLVKVTTQNSLFYSYNTKNTIPMSIHRDIFICAAKLTVSVFTQVPALQDPPLQFVPSATSVIAQTGVPSGDTQALFLHS